MVSFSSGSQYQLSDETGYCHDSAQFPTPLRRAQNQFAAAIPKVASTTIPSRHRTVVSSNPVKARAPTANAVPPGNRKAAPPGLFRRNAGNAAATAPYINSRATAESVAFHRKSPEIENISSNTANARIEMCGVRNLG